MASKQERSEHEHDEHNAGSEHRPNSQDQAPAGSSEPAHEPVNTSGLTGPDAPPDHSGEVKADAHHSHKGHVEMAKDGVRIRVHPETVAAHEAAGWYRH